MHSLALELKDNFGIIEPFQLQTSLNCQLDELYSIITKTVSSPVILVGFSWGAWLAYLFSARYSNESIVSKLILIGSGPYTREYYLELIKNRRERMNDSQQELSTKLFSELRDPTIENKETILLDVGRLYHKIVQYDPAPFKFEEFLELPFSSKGIYRTKYFNECLNEVMAMRKSGELLDFASKITIPVVAIHGDYDPHPADGVIETLRTKLSNFRWHLLQKCGHKPWQEKQAKELFFSILQREIHSNN